MIRKLEKVCLCPLVSGLCMVTHSGIEWCHPLPTPLCSLSCTSFEETPTIKQEIGFPSSHKRTQLLSSKNSMTKILITQVISLRIVQKWRSLLCSYLSIDKGKIKNQIAENRSHHAMDLPMSGRQNMAHVWILFSNFYLLAHGLSRPQQLWQLAVPYRKCTPFFNKNWLQNFSDLVQEAITWKSSSSNCMCLKNVQVWTA